MFSLGHLSMNVEMSMRASLMTLILVMNHDLTKSSSSRHSIESMWTGRLQAFFPYLMIVINHRFCVTRITLIKRTASLIKLSAACLYVSTEALNCRKPTTLMMMFSLIIFSVVTTLPCLTLIFNSMTINARKYARRCVGIFFLSLLFFFSHILTNIEFKHVTSTYYHSWYLIYIDFDVTYIRRVIDI